MSEPIIKRCPACLDQGMPDVMLVERQNKTSGGFFLGCSRWPSCQHTQPIPEHIRMRQLGADPLPGFE